MARSKKIERRERSVITIATKRSIIKDRENGMLVKELAKKYKLQSATISNIWRLRHKIKNSKSGPGTVSIVRTSRSEVNEQMEEDLKKWMEKEEREGREVTNTEIRNQALLFHMLLREEIEKKPSTSKTTPIPIFSASTGWLRKFLRRMKKIKTSKHKKEEDTSDTIEDEATDNEETMSTEEDIGNETEDDRRMISEEEHTTDTDETVGEEWEPDDTETEDTAGEDTEQDKDMLSLHDTSEDGEEHETHSIEITPMTVAGIIR